MRAVVTAVLAGGLVLGAVGGGSVTAAAPSLMEGRAGDSGPNAALSICPSGAPTLRPLRAALDARVAPSFRMGPYAVVGERAALFWHDDLTRQLRMLHLAADGAALGAPGAVLPTARERSSAHVSSDGRCLGIASMLWRGTDDRTVAFARYCASQGWSAELELAHELANDPIVAVGSHGRFGVAWLVTDGLENNHLGFAVVSADATKLESSGRALADVRFEGMSLIGREDGWLLVGARASTASRGGLYAVRLDAQGHHLEHGELIRGEGGRVYAPVLARHGNDAAVVFTLDRDLAFLPLTLDGSPRGPAVLLSRFGAESAGEIGSGLIPTALHHADGVWWVAYERRQGSAHYQAQLVTTDGARVSAPIHVGGHGRGSMAMSLAPAAPGLLAAVYEDPWSGHDRVRTFALCQPPAPRGSVTPLPSAEPAPKRCERKVVGMPIHHYDPVRAVFELAALQNDLAVGYATDSGHHLARMERGGTVVWTHPLSQERGMPPAVGATRDAVGVVWSAAGALRFAAFAADGKPLIAPQSLGAASGRACVAPLADGWAVVAAELTGSRYLRLGRDGAVRARASAPAAMECGLAPADTGLLLAVTRPGPMSETNYLYTYLLGADGAARTAARTPSHTIEQRFARSPVLLRTAGGYALAWADPLVMERGEAFRFVRLDGAGAPIGTPTAHGWNHDTGGWGVVPGTSAPLLIHASHIDYVEQPLCPDEPQPPPPRPPRPPRWRSEH